MAPGTIFALNTDGSGFTNLHNFALPGDQVSPFPYYSLSFNNIAEEHQKVLWFYPGTPCTEVPRTGGSSGHGTLFAIKPTERATRTFIFSAAETTAQIRKRNWYYPATLFWHDTSGGTSGKGTLFALSTDRHRLFTQTYIVSRARMTAPHRMPAFFWLKIRCMARHLAGVLRTRVQYSP